MTLNGVTRPTIAGHRDVASTACPGSYIYSRMGELRTNVTNLMGAATAPTAKVALAPLLPSAADEPNTFEVLLHVTSGGQVEAGVSALGPSENRPSGPLGP